MALTAAARALHDRISAEMKMLSVDGLTQRACLLSCAAEAIDADRGRAGTDATRRQLAARAAWDEAATAWDQACQPYPLTIALLRAAAAALAAGDRGTGTERLQRAALHAGRLGAEALREDISQLARRARIMLGAEGGQATGPAGQGRLGLTAREYEVLRLVAAGRTNPEIAGELFISAKTASVHVSSILAKLGVTGRGEAAATAHRLGLFDGDQ
jgi:DNA-binding CsgD family transcriptional regulator